MDKVNIFRIMTLTGLILAGYFYFNLKRPALESRLNRDLEDEGLIFTSAKKIKDKSVHHFKPFTSPSKDSSFLGQLYETLKRKLKRSPASKVELSESLRADSPSEISLNVPKSKSKKRKTTAAAKKNQTGNLLPPDIQDQIPTATSYSPSHSKSSGTLTGPIGPAKATNPEPVDTTPTGRIPTSYQPNLNLTTSRPSGSYLFPPTIDLRSNAESIRYCKGSSSSPAPCCDPSDGVLYQGSFQLAATNGDYCISAMAFYGTRSSMPHTWYYTVDQNLISMNILVPQRTVYQTQQLYHSMIVSSAQFGDATLNFIQRITTQDPGSNACDVLQQTSTPQDDMISNQGNPINFSQVTGPLIFKLSLANKLSYGTNYIVSIIERIMNPTNEYLCQKNVFMLSDFHLDSAGASSSALSAGAGGYTLQGGLNFVGALNSTGEAIGTNGVILEHGFVNIIN